MSETKLLVAKDSWEWFGCAGHLIVGHMCRFHMCTKVGAFFVSTVGEYWPPRSSREIHAKYHDPKWLDENRHRLGDDFDSAYMERFGFETIGAGEDSLYETLVFRTAGGRCERPDCGCGLPEVDWSEVGGSRYKTAGEATRGHMEFCEAFATRGADWKTEWELESAAELNAEATQ